MEKQPSEGIGPQHRTVASGFEIKTGGKAIAVGFTGQKLSAHAGSAVFWGWLRPSGWIELLERSLPHRAAGSNNHLTALEKALGFMHGILCDARKLTHVAYLRRDPLLPDLLGVRRVASQSSLTRFFQGFGSAGVNPRCFRGMWRWCLERLPSRSGGYTLDLDSTRLLHEDGGQEGVRPGYTRMGIKPCLHPLLAMLSEVRLVVQFWLRPGNAACSNNVEAFFCDLWHNLPRHIRLRAVRADAGFCVPRLLDLWDSLRLSYVVVAQLSQPIKHLLRRDSLWQATEIDGTEVTDVEYQSIHWQRPRRLILIRRRTEEKGRGGGKMLLDVPGYLFQALVTNLPPSTPPLEVWRFYNQRADCENVIKELASGFGLSTLICRKFFSTEAVLSLAVLTYNLTVLFQRHLGWLQKVTIHSLRFWLFITPGIISHPANKTTIKLAVPPRERNWWSALWRKILSPIPNCNAVENRPAFT